MCAQEEMAQAGELQENSSSDEKLCVISFGAMWRLWQWQWEVAEVDSCNSGEKDKQWKIMGTGVKQT